VRRAWPRSGAAQPAEPPLLDPAILSGKARNKASGAGLSNCAYKLGFGRKAFLETYKRELPAINSRLDIVP
jgi:hypothetical protein